MLQSHFERLELRACPSPAQVFGRFEACGVSTSGLTGGVELTCAAGQPGGVWSGFGVACGRSRSDLPAMAPPLPVHTSARPQPPGQLPPRVGRTSYATGDSDRPVAHAPPRLARSSGSLRLS